MDESAGTTARVASPQGGGISSLKSRTRLTQPPGHGSGAACQVGYGSSVHFCGHSAVKCGLQGAVNKVKQSLYSDSLGIIDQEYNM